MAGLSRRTRIVLLAAAALWAAVIVLTAAHKSGDLVLSLEPSQRLLAGDPLYLAPPHKGLWWPPFTAAQLAPFALLARASLSLAKAAWAIGGVACVVWSVVTIERRWGWLPALLPLLVLARAIHNNFEHGQSTAVLLALVVAAALELDRGREARAGAWIGAAAAVKAFPGLLLLYLAITRRWGGLLVGAGTAAVLTLGALVPYGPLGAAEALGRWLTLAASAPGTDGFAMQKLGRLVHDLGGATPALLAAHVALLASVAVTLPRRADALHDVGLVTVTAVLVSPVGWFYYFGLLLPAGAAVVVHLPREGDRRPWYVALGIASLLVSGYLRLIPYPGPLAFLTKDNDTLGALILLGVLIAQRWRDPTRRPA